MKKYWAFLILVIVVLGAVIYFAFFHQKGDEGKEDEKGPGTGGSGKKSELTPDDRFPLQFGSYGERVKQLQRYLNLVYGENLKDDGDFGSNTNAAVKKRLNSTVVTEAVFNTLAEKAGNLKKGGSPSVVMPIVDQWRNMIAKPFKYFE